MDIRHLPPKPDRVTGEPRPPAAPLESEGATQEEPRHRARSKTPNPPEAEGKMLEWFYPTRTVRFLAGATVSVILIIFGCIYDGGFSWMGVWWLWLFILPCPFLFLLIGREGSMSAGAEWFAISNKSYVNTYELITVKVHLTGSAFSVEMTDNGNRRVEPRIGNIQRNPRLWDLVYNGILHSVHVGGAETNKRARDYLRLDHPPHLNR